jgi:hypothetical protein
MVLTLPLGAGLFVDLATFLESQAYAGVTDNDFAVTGMQAQADMDVASVFKCAGLVLSGLCLSVCWLRSSQRRSLGATAWIYGALLGLPCFACCWAGY